MRHALALGSLAFALVAPAPPTEAGPGASRGAVRSERHAGHGSGRHHHARGRDDARDRRLVPGYFRGTAPPPPARYGEVPATGRCSGTDRTVVVVDRDRGRDRTVVVVADERSRPPTPAHHPVHRHDARAGTDRTAWDGELGLAVTGDRGGVVLATGLDRRSRHHFRAAGGLGDCRRTGTVLAESGPLYVKVRADGRLEIRSR
jgi:hypothetical protein